MACDTAAPRGARSEGAACPREELFSRGRLSSDTCGAAALRRDGLELVLVPVLVLVPA